jgi:uncharacterized protein involved in exopolysaccharide biosynthesis
MLLMATATVPVSGQTDAMSVVRASAAYAELKLRKTEVEADLEALSANYTAESPRIVELKAEVAGLDAAVSRLLKVRPADPGRFTVSLGKLLVRHAALSVEVLKHMRTYAPDHPEVLRAKRRVEVFDRAIKEILP